MVSIRNALAFSVLTQNSIQIISFGTIIILARLLTPAEIGVFAVASSVAFLAIELRSLGASQYLIREEAIDEGKIRSAFGLMLTISWSLAVAIILLAPSIAEFYQEQALKELFWIISGTFFLAPFSGIPSALLARNLDFRKLFVIRLTSSLVRCASTIGLVLYGLSYYGLAIGTLLGAVAELAMVTYYRPSGTPWWPSFNNFRILLVFGFFTSTANTLRQFSLSIPDLVLGRAATMTDVGLFSRGLGTVSFINKLIVKAVEPVVLPYFSMVRRDKGSMEKAYLSAISMQAAFCWPVFAVVSLSAYPMIRALFGDQWDDAVPVASILAAWAMLQSTHGMSTFVLVAVDREKLAFNKELIIFVTRLIAILVSAPYGLKHVAWAMVFSGLIELLVNSWAIKRALLIDYRSQLFCLLSSMQIAAICWGILKLMSLVIDFYSINPWICLVLIAIFMIPTWLVSLRLVRHELWPLVFEQGDRLLRGSSRNIK